MINKHHLAEMSSCFGSKTERSMSGRRYQFYIKEPHNEVHVKCIN